MEGKERKVTVGAYTHSILDLPKHGGIRWAVGAIDGARSSTWRLWGNKKGDSYLAMRALGGQLKVSIHKDRRCSVGFTKEFEAEAKNRFGANSRHWERWLLPDGPVVKAFQILVPDCELSVFASKESEPMRWIDRPGDGKAATFTVFIAEPNSGFNWDNPQEHGNVIGIMSCKSRTTWVVYTYQEMNEGITNLIVDGRKKAGEQVAGKINDDVPEGVRMTLWGFGSKGADPYFIDLDGTSLIKGGA